MKTITLTITGRVQGVFYRKSTVEQAEKLGLTGEVWNEDDGSVKLIATGDDAALAALVSWCHDGPPRANVSEVIVTDIPLQSFDSFRTRR